MSVRAAAVCGRMAAVRQGRGGARCEALRKLILYVCVGMEQRGSMQALATIELVVACSCWQQPTDSAVSHRVSIPMCVFQNSVCGCG